MGQTRRDFSNNKQSMLEHLWNEQANNQNLDEQIFRGLFQETLCCICGNVEKLPIQNWGK